MERWKAYFEKLLNEKRDHKEPETHVPTAGPIPLVTTAEVQGNMTKMKKGKCCGPDGIPIEALQCLGNRGVAWLTTIFNKIIKGGAMPNEWRTSTISPIFKGKGDHMKCSNYRGIKLLSHTLKLWERILDTRLRALVDISSEQFGFLPGKSTTDAIFILRTTMEKFREVQAPLHLLFVDLEKAYDTVPREIMWSVMRERNIPEFYITLTADTYNKCVTSVKSKQGLSGQFEIEVGLHQGSALSPFLFILLLDTITREVRMGTPWDLLYADDLALVRRTTGEIQQSADAWNRVLKENGLKINATKTQQMATGLQGDPIYIEGEEIEVVSTFKYLGAVISKDGALDADITHRTQAAWASWRALTGVLHDRRMPLKLKAMLYTSVVRPALCYGSECWPMLVQHKRKMAVTEMRMLRRIAGISKMDHVPNIETRRKLNIPNIEDVLASNRLRWFGHTMRRDPESATRRALEMQLPGRRARGRPKMTWQRQVNVDMASRQLTSRDTQNRLVWRTKTRPTPPTG